MTPTTITLFNNKGGVGKTSLLYHLAWMYRELGWSVLAADLDPQSNLTAAFLAEERLEDVWPPDDDHAATIFGAVEPLMKGVGDIRPAHVEQVDERLHLIAGDLALSTFEDELSTQWPACLDGKERAFRVASAFSRILQAAAARIAADIILVDVGPNLGALNRSALIMTDHVVLPLAPDLFSLQGLRNLGPTLRQWRHQWRERVERKPPGVDLPLPAGRMAPAGYVVLMHAVRLDRPVRAYERWIARIPGEYRASVLGEKPANGEVPNLAQDPHCLDLVKHYRSLMPMSQEAGKPIFLLKPADGAIGGHGAAVVAAYRDFERLARRVARQTGCDGPAG